MDTQPTIQSTNIGALIRKKESDYVAGTTKTSKYVETNQYETLNKIDAYLNSKHVSGEFDSKGREKPFFNIVTAEVNIWYRATQIDKENIHIKATKSTDDVAAFLATCHLQVWMNKAKFDKFLSQWGRTMARYCSAVSKFVVKKGDLVCSVVPWNRIICDVIDFYANPVIEKLEYTPAQLRTHKEYDQVIVEKLINTLQAREDLNKEKRDILNDYITLYEIHGELPLSYLTGLDKDADTFRQQMQVLTFIAGKEKGEFDDFILFKGKEAQSPYRKDDLLEEPDQTLGIGPVQQLFESQWMVNHSMKNIKDQLDLASKLVFQTPDANFVGQNALTNIQQGDILIHATGSPLTQVGNNTQEVSQQQNLISVWRNLGREVNGISEAMAGQNPPSGSAWRQTQALLQESHSLFEVMTKNKAIALEEMFQDFIIPFFKTKMDNKDEVAVTLNSYGIKQIDARYIPNQAIRLHNAVSTEAVLNGQVPPVYNKQQAEQGLQDGLNQQGTTRFIKPSELDNKTWKQYFKDLEMQLNVDIPVNQTYSQAVMDTLNSALKIFMTATPTQLENPNFKLVFNKILEMSSVVSPIEIAETQPYIPLPTRRLTETMDYKDTPPDVQRQIEEQAGLNPSTMQPQQNQGQPLQTIPPVPAQQNQQPQPVVPTK